MSLQGIRNRCSGRLRLSVVVLALSAAIVAGCAGDKDDELKYVETPVDKLYNKAVDALSVSRYLEAAKRFDEVERQHPYSVWARRAMLMSAYCYYKSNKYDDAILAAKRFIQLHPGNRDVAYAYYLIGVSYYEQISDVGRDQKMTENALKALRDVVRRFPGSDYARDARVKVDMTLDHLAGKEMAVGRWYLRRHQPLAAINRFTNVVRDYQTTSHVPEALLRLTEAYLTMGVYNEAQATAAVLGYNFPGSKWYEDAYELLKDRDLQPKGSGDIKSVEAQPDKKPAPAKPDPKAAAAPAPAPVFAENGASPGDDDAKETAEVQADAAPAGQAADEAASGAVEDTQSAEIQVDAAPVGQAPSEETASGAVEGTQSAEAQDDAENQESSASEEASSDDIPQGEEDSASSEDAQDRAEASDSEQDEADTGGEG